MRKTKNRFLAFLVVFTSIVSFLPVGFSGQEAKAATNSMIDAAVVTQVRVDGYSESTITPRTDSDTNEKIYNTNGYFSSFNITYDSMASKWETYVKSVRTNVDEAVYEQRIAIMEINGITLATKNAQGLAVNSTAGYAKLADMGISIDTAPNINPTSRKGVRINGLPAGVNKITYQVELDVRKAKYTPATTTNNITTEETATIDPVANWVCQTVEPIVIDNGTSFVQSAVDKMTFKTYIGDSEAFTDRDVIDQSKSNANTNTTNNQAPFLYVEDGIPAGGEGSMKLRYSYGFSGKASALKYVLSFNSTNINLSNATIFKKGEKLTLGEDYQIDSTGTQLTGYLTKQDGKAVDLIVIKIDEQNQTGSMARTYALEIRYHQIFQDNDYSMLNANITKLDPTNDSADAYIGKVFKISGNTDGGAAYNVYKGKIYIDSKASMINLDPQLGVSKSNVVYEIHNQYVPSEGAAAIDKGPELHNGKQYIKFNMSAINKNTILLDVKDKEGDKIIARYELEVVIDSSDEFNMDLGVSGTSSGGDWKLTQPGVKSNFIDFTKSRLTYELYPSGLTTDKLSSLNVGLKLIADNNSETGKRSSRNEYIRAWLVNDKDSNNRQEAQESKDNALIIDSSITDPTNASKYKRNYNLQLNGLDKTEKIVVQAYYDQFEYDVDGTIKLKDDNITPVYTSLPLGEKYEIYIPNNYDTSNDPITDVKSSDASLSKLQINGSDILSGSTTTYTTTVAKADTTVKIIPTTTSAKVKSIIATIDGAKDSIDLFSGEEKEISLNSNGKTPIAIEVTAEDGTIKKYTVTIQNSLKGSSANLKNVVLNVGDYNFDSKNDVTKVRVDQNISSIKVTPLAEDAKAKVTVNGQTFLQNPISISLKGSQKTEISIEVRSEDGTMSKTYTLEVYRVSVADWQEENKDPDNDPDEVDQFYDDYNKCWVDLSKYEEWGTVNGKPAYFDKKGRQVKDAWISTGGKNYYLNNLGYRASGWKVDDAGGKTYYLDPSTGEMKKEWMNLNNSWYYLGLNGVMKKGWLNLNNKWYYFTQNGQMIVNQTMYIDDGEYRFGQDGAIY